MARRRGSRRSRGRSHSRDRQTPRYATAPQVLNSVYVTVPMPDYLNNVRMVSYTYPLQQQRRRRVIRQQLSVPRGARYRMRRVRVLVPHVLPVARGSYVSTDRRGRLNIHSLRQFANLMAVENNRRRYLEGKKRKRSARNGQLDSPGSTRHGLVAEAVRRGLSPEVIADAALVARSLDGSRR